MAHLPVDPRIPTPRGSVFGHADSPTMTAEPLTAVHAGKIVGYNTMTASPGVAHRNYQADGSRAVMSLGPPHCPFEPAFSGGFERTGRVWRQYGLAGGKSAE